jgi:hypothetical protein
VYPEIARVAPEPGRMADTSIQLRAFDPRTEDPPIARAEPRSLAACAQSPPAAVRPDIRDVVDLWPLRRRQRRLA